MRRATFAAWGCMIAALVVAQSVIHLTLTLGEGRIGTFVDLDRSNGLPDLISTAALAAAATGAGVLAAERGEPGRHVPAAASGLLAFLTIADLLHDGAHPFRRGGPVVVAAVMATILLVAVVGRDSSKRATITLALAVVLLAGSFVTGGLDQMNHRFERARGEATAEYVIVVKEGLELAGWALVALALWDEAFRRRAVRHGVTAPASPARVTSRRRAA